MLQFLRIWDQLSQKQQKFFATDFRQNNGRSIYHLIDELREVQSEIEQMGANASEEAVSEDHDSSRSSVTKNSSDSPANNKDEQLKATYKKLVRRLHPDIQVQNQQMTEDKLKWQKQMWLRVQDCYKRKDLQGLTKLLQLTVLRMGSLSELTLSEIKDSANWLAQELKELQGQAASYKHLPAWGFSRKNDLSSLQRKIEKSILKDLESIQETISDIQSQHFMLELLANEPPPTQRRRRAAKAQGRGRRR
jgi:hypothetical protein